MRRRRIFVTFSALGGLALGGCSSDGGDDSPSVTEVQVDPADPALSTTTSPTFPETPSTGTGLVSIDGPATVDPSFPGADGGG